MVASFVAHRRVGFITAFVSATLCAVSVAHAETAPANSARACLDEALAAASHYEGVQLLQPVQQEFLLAGDVRSHAHELTSSDCLGFVAVGPKYTQDIQLDVQSADGRVLARGQGPSATPYVSYCGRAGERVLVTVRVMDGQGEVIYAALSHAQQTIAALQALERCPWIGVSRPPSLDVGPEPQARSIAEELERLNGQLEPLGYRPARLLSYGALAAGQHEARAMSLDENRCYALAAVGSRDVVDLDLRLFGGPGLSIEPLSADTSRRRNALVKLCASAPARYLLDIAMFQGQGAYAVQALLLQEPQPEAPPGVTGNARIAYAETQRRMKAHGFSAEPTGSGVVRPDEELRLPLSLATGQCYALAAISSGDAHRPGLELSLIDEHGELLAVDGGAGRDPLLFHCAQRQGQVSVVVRARDARSPARFVLLLGRDQPQAPQVAGQ